jgi:mono/diheme cytochrome c family protein
VPTTRPASTRQRARVYFSSLCAGCHGTDGKKVKDGPPLGSVADNGAEMMHKLQNGQQKAASYGSARWPSTPSAAAPTWRYSPSCAARLTGLREV